MKRLLIVLSILLFAGSSLAGSGAIKAVIAAKRGAAGGGGGPDTYYYSMGSDTYAQNTNIFSIHTFSDDITIGANGNITKIGVKVHTVGSASNFKLSLWSGGSWTLHECGVVAVTGTGWLDLTLTTPLAVVGSQVVRVGAVPDDNSECLVYYNSSGSGFWTPGEGYLDSCVDPFTGDADPGYGYPIRVYVD